MNCRLPDRTRLRRKQDLERVLFRGQRARQGPVVLYFAPAQPGWRRAAFIAAGKFRTAVGRNRVRRRLREIFRTNQNRFPEGYDFILRGEAPVLELEFAELERMVLDLLHKVPSR